MSDMGEQHTVIGAGPAGLVAAATLARAGRRVILLEKAGEVGHRFAGDIQGLENWSQTDDAFDRLAQLGVEPTFPYRPLHEVTFYDHRLRPVVGRSPAPLCYLVRRGPQDGSFDRALLEQARSAGVEVRFGRAAERALRGDIVAIGPRFADGIATGYVFRTRLEDQAHCIISEELAPAGYAYLLIWDGHATLATCLFDRSRRSKDARRRTVETFRRLVPGLDLENARPFSGYGSVFGEARFTDEAGRLYVGEAAGLQDPEWGFGMWYAMESGALAARSLLDGFDYATAAAPRFEPRRRTALANRLLYESLPEPAVDVLIRWAATSPGIRRRIRRHWTPNRAKSAIAQLARRRFARTRLHYRDRACHLEECDCVWCTHGDDHRDRACTGIAATEPSLTASGRALTEPPSRSSRS
jgi:flavin-dependent dehydrogenase